MTGSSLAPHRATSAWSRATGIPSLRHLPGPRGADFVRLMLHFIRDSLGALEACRREYGELVAFHWPISTVILYDPADVRRVLVDNRAAYGKGAQTRELSAMMGEGLVTNDDRSSWARRRPLVGQAMSASAVRRAALVFASVADVEVRRLEASSVPVDVASSMRRLTFEIASKTLLGGRLTEEEGRRIDEAVLFGSEVVHRHMFRMVPIPYWVPTPEHLRFRRDRRVLDGILTRLVADARATSSRDEDGSVLARLVAARDPDSGAPLSDQELRDEIVTALVAGYETTASTLAWVLGLYAFHPEVQARVRAEVDAAGVEIDSLGFAKTHPYTHATLLEALRLYTAIPMTSHRTREGDHLSGHWIPPHTNVVVPTWVIHRDPHRWADADTFSPERFLGCPERRQDHYLPFSKGERGCVGQAFAMVELASIATRIVARLEISPSAPSLPRAVSEVSLKPEGGLLLRFTSRRDA